MADKKIELKDLEITSFITGQKIYAGGTCTKYCNKGTYLCKVTCEDCDL